MNTDYDVLVIGAGPAGENAADRAQSTGLKAAVIEAHLVGGECSYYACMPSKGLLRPGEVLNAVGRVPGAAAAVTGSIDIEAALARRDSLSANFDDSGQVGWLESEGIDLLRGHGRIVGERLVEVEAEDGSTVTYQAGKAVIIATGTGAAWPPIPGLDDIGAWDNRDITTAKEVPRRLVVLGGGVVGVEMAQAWKSLGTEEVTIIEAEERLLPREEPFVGKELASAFERLGINLIVGVKMVAASREAADGPVTATLENGSLINGDELLVAVGRRPNTRDIGLETIGLEPGGYITVNDHMQTGPHPWLYAVGDVNGRALLTHTGKYQARVAGDHIAGKAENVTAYGDVKAIPRVIFTDPQIAAVGLTEAEARKSHDQVSAVSYNIGHTAGAATLGRGIRGTAQLVIDDADRVILGATFIGPGAGELLHAATIAIIGGVTLDQLWHAIPAFPTMSEVWLRFLEEYGL
ncbi:MAG: NAD(P)/FAD-dependent oxidoreductase [Acidimicrobiia bacterium]|nr:NAD(P)/FAD-dependent oxidoreductase [Acidimicrobiia bacterium]